MKLYSLIFALLFLVSCDEDRSNDGFFKTSSPEYGLENDMMLEESMIVSYETEKPQAPSQEQKIIKTGNLSFETQELEKTHEKIRALSKQYEGIIQQDVSGKNYSRVFQQMTIRIPSENFQVFVDGISDGVAYFDRREISQRDVTEEFVDIEARLVAKKELEKRYLELLKQAKNVKEMLEIERELSAIREEIEARQGRLKYLQSQVSMSTVHLDFYKTTAETGVTLSYGQKIKNALQGGWDGISIFFLGLLYMWPLFVLAIIVILVIRWLIRRSKRTKSTIND